MRGRLLAGVVAVGLASAPGVAVAEDGDSAVCETQEVTVTGKNIPVMAEPSLESSRLFTAAKGEFFTCSAVKIGAEHSQCGAKGSEVWIILTDFERFDAYVPSHCVADVFR